MIRNLHNSREYDLPRAKVFLFPTPRPNELLCNCARIIGRDGRELNPLRVEDITEAEINGRRKVREYARFVGDRLVGCENSLVNDTGVQIGVRQTRQIRDVGMLTNDDVVRAPSARIRSRTRPGLHRGAGRTAWLGRELTPRGRAASHCRNVSSHDSSLRLPRESAAKRRMKESKMLTWLRMDQREVMHSIRTAIAAVVSLLIARFCRLPESYWAAVTTIVYAINSWAAWTSSALRAPRSAGHEPHFQDIARALVAGRE